MNHKKERSWKEKKKTKYRQYSPSSMTNAYKAVIEQKLSVKRASINYGVPQNTLRQRVLGRLDPETLSSGPKPVLNQEEEAIFVEHLQSMAQIGYGYTSTEVIDMASNYAVYLNKRDQQHHFSMKWFRCFMKRWPELRLNKPRALAIYRAKAASEQVISDYFSRLDDILIKYNLKGKPQCINNVDEKGIQTEHTPPYVVTAEKSTPAVTSSRGAITTILGCGNALGTMIPPYYIFKGKRVRVELLEGSTTGSAGTVSDSGWSNTNIFQEYLQNHFLKYVQRESPDQPVLLIFDGHKSHINIPVINWANANNIILFVLPAHTSHILQPLDVGCFGPLQRIFNSECHRFIRDNPSSQITRYNVASLSSKAYENALSPANLKASFKRTGIYPFDPSVIKSSELAPSSAFIPPTNPTELSDETNNPVEQDVEPLADSDESCCHGAGDENNVIDVFKPLVQCITNKQELEIKTTNNISKIVSGTAITESDTLKKIENCQSSSGTKKTATKQTKSKKNYSAFQIKIFITCQLKVSKESEKNLYPINHHPNSPVHLVSKCTIFQTAQTITVMMIYQMMKSVVFAIFFSQNRLQRVHLLFLPNGHNATSNPVSTGPI